VPARASTKPRKKLRKPAPQKKRRARRASTAPAAAESGAGLTEKPRDLTAKQDRFCQEYMIDLNGAAAAVRAGYSAATARQIAYETIHLPQVQERLAALMNARAVRTRISKDRVLTSIAESAYFDPANLVNEKHALKALHDMPPEVRQQIVGIEIVEMNIDGVPVGHIKKVRLADPLRARELLGRHLKLFTDKLEINDKTGLAERIRKARARKGD